MIFERDVIIVKKLETRKEVNAMALLFATVYMISYITRINYSAIISEMENATGISRSMLSMALTGSFVTYGVGQIISGICGDRFSPKKLVAMGLGVTVAMNLLIPLCTNAYQMLAVWCVNGFAQSFMWPPMVRIVTFYLTENDYKVVSAKVSWGSSVGTIAVYLAAPVLISFFGWKSVFLFSAVFGVAMIFVWNRYSYDMEASASDNEAKRIKGSSKMLFTPLMLCVMLAIILQGMLRDGVTTWMPTYISETYKLGTSVSILTGVVLPIFSIICYHTATKLYMTKLNNPLSCAGVFFAIGALSAVGLYLLTGQNAVYSVLFSAVLTGCMHGVNIMLICMIPPYFKKYGNVSTASGVLNSCTYIGSALSTYGVALLSESFGWSLTLLVWLIIAASGTAVCMICAKPWKKYMVE